MHVHLCLIEILSWCQVFSSVSFHFYFLRRGSHSKLWAHRFGQTDWQVNPRDFPSVSPSAGISGAFRWVLGIKSGSHSLREWSQPLILVNSLCFDYGLEFSCFSKVLRYTWCFLFEILLFNINTRTVTSLLGLLSLYLVDFDKQCFNFNLLSFLKIFFLLISLRINSVVCHFCTKSLCGFFFFCGFSCCSFLILPHLIEIEYKKWFRFLYLLSLYVLLWYLKNSMGCYVECIPCSVWLECWYLWGPFDLWCHWQMRMRYWSYYFYVRSVLWNSWCICAAVYPDRVLPCSPGLSQTWDSPASFWMFHLIIDLYYQV